MMKQYLELCKYILESGENRDDCTGTRSVFEYQTRYDLRDGFSLLTTKKMFLGPIAEDLLHLNKRYHELWIKREVIKYVVIFKKT